MNWNRILPDLYLGTCPASLDDIFSLADLGVGVIVNLQTEEDMETHSLPYEELSALYAKHGFELVWIEMNDHEIESVRERLPYAVEALDRYLDEGWAVYLHCTSGVNRAPTAAIAYLAAHGDMSLDEAVEHVATRRECLPFVEAVEDWLAEKS